MKSKRYKKLPEKTKEQPAEVFDKVLSSFQMCKLTFQNLNLQL